MSSANVEGPFTGAAAQLHYYARQRMPALCALFLLGQAIHLADALARARSQGPEMAAAREALQVARAGVEVAGQLQNPTVGLSVGPDDPKVFGTFDVKLPLLGQRGAAIAAAERDVEVAQAEADARWVLVRSLVRKAYAALGAAQMRAALSRAALQLAAELEQKARAKVSSGLSPQLEAVQAGLLRRRAQQEAADRGAALFSAREELGRLLGARDAAAIETADPLLPLPQPPPIADLLERAQRHPEVRSLLRQEDAARARAHREAVALRPLPDLTLEFEKPADRTTVGVRTSIAFDLPLLSLNGGRIHEAQAQASLASAQANAALLRRQSELRAVRARWDAASARAQAFAIDIVPAAQELVRMARDAWDLGRTPLTAVLLAQTDLASAQGEGADAALAAQQAFADLEEAAGDAL